MSPVFLLHLVLFDTISRLIFLAIIMGLKFIRMFVCMYAYVYMHACVYVSVVVYLCICTEGKESLTIMFDCNFTLAIDA